MAILGNRDALLYSKFDALTQQLSKLNVYYREQVNDAKQAKVQEKNDQQVADRMARKAEPYTTSDLGVHLPPGPTAQKAADRQIRNALAQYHQQQNETDTQKSGDTSTSASFPPSRTGFEESDEPVKSKTLLAAQAQKSSASTPPDATPEQESSASTAPDAKQEDEAPTDERRTRQDMDAMTMMMGGEMLGAEGTPKALRDFAIRAYMTKRSIGWAQTMADKVQGWAGAEGGGWASKAAGGLGVGGAAGGISKALGFASEKFVPIFAAYEGLKHMTGELGQYQNVGQQLGYGAPPGGQSLFGFHNPLGYIGTGARVGAAYQAETQALQGRFIGGGFGGGLTGAQAHATMQTLGQQGFGMAPVGAAQGIAQSIPLIGGPLGDIFSTFSHPHGDAATIAQNLFRPILGQFPGIQAKTLGEFTPTLRYGGTSIQELTDSLKQLGIEAKSAKMPVDEFAQQVAQSGNQMQQMGSSFMGSQQTAQNLTAVTGLPPGLAPQLAQNPLVQTSVIGQGYLPSQTGDMPGGAFNSAVMTAIQHAVTLTSGVGNQIRSQDVPGFGHITEKNTQGQNDLIASMFPGMTPYMIQKLRKDMPKIQARNQLESWLGKGSYIDNWVTQAQEKHGGKLTDAEYRHMAKTFNDPRTRAELHQALSPKEYKDVMSKGGMRDRIKALQGDIAEATKDDPTNQIQNNPNAQTVQVEFTGMAARYFQQVNKGVSPAKAASNSGLSGMPSGQNYATVANSPTGDITNLPHGGTMGGP